MMNSKLFKPLCLSIILVLLLASLSFTQDFVYVKAAPTGSIVSTNSGTFVDIPNLQLSFVQNAPGDVSISISAECFATNNEYVHVRALVDGHPAFPEEVILSNLGFVGSHSFNFTAHVPDGFHEVTMQYHCSGGAVIMKNRTMWLTTAPDLVYTIAAPTGTQVTTTNTTFQNIPNLAFKIQVPDTMDVALTLTAEAWTSESYSTGNQWMYVRALVDGQPTNPSVVEFATGPFTGTHAFTFVAKDIQPGSHNVQMQWKVGKTGHIAYMRERTVTIGYCNSAAVASGKGGVVSLSAPSNSLVFTTSSSYSDIPLLKKSVVVPKNGTLAVSVTAEAVVWPWLSAPPVLFSKMMFVRALIDGNPIEPTEVWFAPDIFTGTCSFGFIQENLKGGVHHVVIQWKVFPAGFAIMGDRNMTLMTFPGPPPPMASASHPVEPVSEKSSLENYSNRDFFINNTTIYKNSAASAKNEPGDDLQRQAMQLLGTEYGLVFDYSGELLDGSDTEISCDFVSLVESLSKLTTTEEPAELSSNTQPKQFQLAQNYPNPFNPETYIPFYLDQDSYITVKIFNLQGQEITTLLDCELPAGNHTVIWNGKDANGLNATSGVYFYQLQTATNCVTKKMTLMR